MCRTLLSGVVLLVLAGNQAQPGDPAGPPRFTIERCWVDYDPNQVVNFVDIEICYPERVSRRQAQEDLLALLNQEMYSWGLSFDYGQLPLWSVFYVDAAGRHHGLSMTVQPMLVDEARE